MSTVHVPDISSTTPSPADPAALGAFRLDSPAEVQALLRQMLVERSRVTLDDGQGGSLSATLEALDGGRLKLRFEARADAPRLRALLDQTPSGAALQAAAYLERIRLQFELAAPQLLDDEDGASLLDAAAPGQIYRLQRRDSFRVRPHTRAPQVRLQDADSTEPIALRIVDLSIGGLALLLPSAMRLDWPLGGTRTVLVELERETSFPASLRLQHRQPPAEAGHQLGCAFARIEPAALRQLQLFIDQTQKLDRLLRGKG